MKKKIKVGIVDAKFYAFHGYYPEENKMGNDFLVNLEVEYEIIDSINENLDKTINYQDLYGIVKSEMKQTKLLLETVIECIASKITSTYSNVNRLKIRIDKCMPQLSGPIKSTFVEVEINS